MAQQAKRGSNKRKSNKGKSTAGIVLCVLACVLFAAGAATLASYYREYKFVEEMRQVVEVDTFYPGVVVDGQDLGGMTQAQAQDMLRKKEQQLAEQYTMKLRYDSQTWNLSVPLQFDTEAVLAQAWAVGRTGTLEERYAVVEALKTAPQQFSTTHTPDVQQVNTLADQIEKELFIQRVDATVKGFVLEQRVFEFTQEVNGRHVEKAQLIQMMNDAIANQNFDWINVPVTQDPAEVTYAQLSSSYGLLATYSTTATRNSNRNTNISLAMAAFNGVAVEPGQTFSINECTGKRTEDKGYKAAGAIVGGVLQDELGGGVCQVSSTLFNAVVRAGLQITERHNHSWPSDYVPAGMDAAIDYPSMDFKFVNNSQGTIYLVSIFDKESRKLTVEVYGVPILPAGTTVDLRSEKIEETPEPAPRYEEDPTLLPGAIIEYRKGRTGYMYNTYVIYTAADGSKTEEFLFKSNYRAIAPIFKYGPGTVISDPSMGDNPFEDDPIIG